MNEIAHQRTLLETQQKFADRKLEDDRQKLQTQFQQVLLDSSRLILIELTSS